MSDKFREAFKEEATELLGELESALLELEQDAGNKGLVDRVFRAMHTIKGSGAMFGFDAVSSFTHEVETVFDLVRKGVLDVSKELIDVTLEARDYVRGMLDAAHPENEEMRNSLLSRLRACLPETGLTPPPEQEKPETPAAPAATQMTSYRIRFRPAADIFLHGTNPVLLLGELRRLGVCRVLAHTDEVPPLEKANPEHCYFYWDIILTTDRGMDAIKDVFIFVEDDSTISIDPIDLGTGPEGEAQYKRIGEILLERGDINSEELAEALASRKRVGEILVDRGIVSTDEVRSALAEQQHLEEIREKRRQEDTSLSVRVRSDKLDSLMNLVGEMVTLQARLTQTSLGLADPELSLVAEQTERLVSGLRDTVMGLRMLPIATSFGRYRRVVRDLAAELGKQVDLVTEGGETELDKSVIERLNDVLVHLTRNSVDHGIEDPAEREKAGKAPKGTVRLSASQSGSHVLIQVTDDGAGLDKDVIRAKGIERGLISADAELSEREIFDLIFLPGFSTAKRVTSVSGRGVGMDVVKRAMDSLGGTIDIKSVKGAGTSITLKIPLTLAIIEGLLVDLAGSYYVLPLQTVEECVELDRAHRGSMESSLAGKIANVRGEIVPYIRLREWFRIGGEAPPIEQIIIVRSDERRFGLVVDSVIGQHQTVIKSLGKLYKDYQGISGATILGDGTVALIVDVYGLLARAQKEQDGSSA